MSGPAAKCLLQSIEDSTKIIRLPDNKTIYLGRNEQTLIVDPVVSRRQIAATADYRMHSLKIETSGINYSGCNGYALHKNGVYYLKHKDQLELLIGRYKYEVVFDPPPLSNKITKETHSPVLKKKAMYSIFDVRKDGAVNPADNTIQNSISWETVVNGELLVYSSPGIKSQEKIASFDLDSTIIATKSGARFSKNVHDWKFNFSIIPKIFNDLFCDNYKIVIFTNQAGIGFDRVKKEQFRMKLEDILLKINVPIQVFVATTKSVYRKPMPGMWHALCNEKNNGIKIDVNKSFYVGDAAGRAANWAPNKKKDHSVADRLFALNLNLKFFTPEEYFLKASAVSFVMPKFDPRNLVSCASKIPSYMNSESEVVLMVGCPASGKTYFCKKYFTSKGYVYINRDSLGSWKLCVKLLETSLKNKQSVVVDNTNPDKATRRKYIDVAKENKCPIKCFLMTTTLDHCKHNNTFRSITDKQHALVGDVILNMYQKQFEKPTLDEGFTDIIKVDFVPDFTNSEHERLYKMFLLDS